MLAKPSLVSSLARQVPITCVPSRQSTVSTMVLGICSIIFSFFGYLMGLGIVGMLASKMSKRAKQYNNAIATAGMITSIIGFVLSVICTIGMMVLFASGIYDRLVNMTM